MTNRLIALFKRHPEYFIGAISKDYALTIHQIRKYQDILLWNDHIENSCYFPGGISWNTNLTWSTGLINEFKDKWDWSFISSYIIGEYWWFDGLLDKYNEEIDWECISSNSTIPWDEKLIDKHIDKIDWRYFSGNFSFTIEQVEKYEKYINFKEFSSNFEMPCRKQSVRFQSSDIELLPLDKTLDFIEKYENKFTWFTYFFNWDYSLSRKETDEIIEEVFSYISKQ